MNDFTTDPCPACKPNTVCRTPSCGRLKSKQQEPFIQKKQAEPVAWESALEFAAQTIELYDDATMRNDYMLDASECAAIIRALKTMYPTQPVQPSASAEDYLRGKYGAYRGHFAWRELEEAFNAGRQAQPVLPAGAQGEPVHFRAVLCSEQHDKALGVVPKVAGFVDKKSAEQFILEKRDFQGWRYSLEPLYTEAPAVAVNEQMREALREAMGWNWLDGDVPDSVVKKCEQALSHVKETPKNEHDSDDVLKRAPLVRLTDEEIVDAFVKGAEKPYENVQRLTYDSGPYEITKLTNAGRNIANAIMDAMTAKNGGQK